MANAYERDMNNIKQRRHIHEKWKFGQGGPGVAQMVPRGGKSLGGAGGRGEGWRGMGSKTTYPRKVEIWAGMAWGGTDGAKRWQITQRGWGEGGGVAGHGHKDDISNPPNMV